MQHFYAILLATVMLYAQDVYGAATSAASNELMLVSGSVGPTSDLRSAIRRCNSLPHLGDTSSWQPKPRSRYIDGSFPGRGHISKSIQWFHEQEVPEGQCIKHLLFDSLYYNEDHNKIGLLVSSTAGLGGLYSSGAIDSSWMNFNGGCFMFATLFGGIVPLGIALNMQHIDFKKLAGSIAFFGCCAIAGGMYIQQKSLSDDELQALTLAHRNVRQAQMNALESGALSLVNTIGGCGAPYYDDSGIKDVIRNNDKILGHIRALAYGGYVNTANGDWVLPELDTYMHDHKDTPRAPFLEYFKQDTVDLNAREKNKLKYKRWLHAAGWIYGGLAQLALAGAVTAYGRL